MQAQTKHKLYKWVLFLVMLLIAFVVAFPFAWMVMSSFKRADEFYALRPTFLPEHFMMDNFTELFEKWSFLTYYKNSIIVTVVQVLSNIIIVLLAGYGFAKYKFKGRNFFFLMILATTMIPWVATIIPLFILTNAVGLIDTYMGLIIPGMANAFNIFLARNFMTGIPDAIIESARIEGAGERKIFFHLILPEVKPLIAVIGIQKMVGSWNAFQWPLLVVNRDSLRTLPIAIAKLSSQYYDSYNLKMAAATVTIIPVIIVYILFSRYFVEGITLSGIK
jgi:multiple sugar transport system permease protein